MCDASPKLPIMAGTIPSQQPVCLEETTVCHLEQNWPSQQWCLICKGAAVIQHHIWEIHLNTQSASIKDCVPCPVANGGTFTLNSFLFLKVDFRTPGLFCSILALCHSEPWGLSELKIIIKVLLNHLEQDTNVTKRKIEQLPVTGVVMLDDTLKNWD